MALKITKPGAIIRRILLYILLIAFFFIFAFPFYYVFILATNSITTMFRIPPPLLPNIPGYTLENFKILFEYVPFGLNFMHSVLIAVLSTATSIFFCTMGGFALSKYIFKGRNAIYSFILITLMIPSFLNIVPVYQMMVWFGWIDTYLPLVVPGMANAFGIFLMRQFIASSVPLELMDAARIDGLNEFSILLRIGFPLATPGIAVLGTVNFIGSWNNFLWALLILTKKEIMTLPVALARFQQQAEVAAQGYGAKMLGNALAIIPILIIFVFFSKQIISNFLAGSLKG
jgi:multiple sugar transport system permease protein